MNAFPFAPFLVSLESDGFCFTLHDYERISVVLRSRGDWTINRLRFANANREGGLLILGVSFSYEERTKYFASLTKQTLERLHKQLTENPHIYFHYSARFSKDDRYAILNAARQVRPNGEASSD